MCIELKPGEKALPRRVSQELRIGDDIRLRVIRVTGSLVLIGVTAPDGERILKAEEEELALQAMDA